MTKQKKAEEQLKNNRQHLAELVKKRTIQLEKKNKELLNKNKELEHYNQLFVGRELRIKDLKDKLKRYEKNNEIL